MPRGRPVGSRIRQNIIELLAIQGKAYGYRIHQHYIEHFPPCTQKSIYYHLKRGIQTGEFVIESIITEKGEYSWGSNVEKIYYKLGPNAKPRGNPTVKER